MKIILAVVLGLLAAFFAAALVAALGSGPGGIRSISLRATEKKVLVTIDALPMAHIIQQDDLELRMISAGDAPLGAFVSSAATLGRVLVAPTVPGQILTARMLAPSGSGPEIASMLTDGYRASTITLSSNGPATFIYPGSLVDVLATFDLPRSRSVVSQTISRTILQGARVLAVEGVATFKDPNEDADSTNSRYKSSRRAPMVTLLLTPSQAQMLHLAADLGSISVTLRPPFESNRSPIAAAATLDGLLGFSSTWPPAPPPAPVESSDDSSKDADADPAPAPLQPPMLVAPPLLVTAPEADNSWITTVTRGGSRTDHTFEDTEK